MPFATEPAVVVSRWRPLTTAEQAVAKTLLADSAAILAASVPRLVERMADGSVSDHLLERVQAAMVLRVLKNPNGHRQESVSVDDATRSWTIDNAVSSGALYLADDELALLSPRRVRAQVGSIRLGVGL